MTDKLLDLLKDKKQAIKLVIDMLDRSQKEYSSLEKGINMLNGGASQATKIDCIQKLMIITQRQSMDIVNLSSILLIYLQSQNFDTDTAHLLVKMGKGEEALKTMFNNKLKGN